jgi:ATP-dependent DNA helicase RecG
LPDQFVPFAKNPLIARFFAQMGRVDELGSGILNVYKYLKVYSPGKKPQFIEEQLFRTIIPLDDTLYQRDGAINGAINSQIRQRLSGEVREIWEKEGATLQELMSAFSIERRTAQRDIQLLKEDGLLDFEGSKKTGKYKLTPKGLKLFE